MKVSRKQAQNILTNNPPHTWQYIQNGEEYQIIAKGKLNMKTPQNKITLNDIMNEIIKIHSILNKHSEILNEHSIILKEHSELLNEHNLLFKQHGWKK